jgi:hypothetical protein
VFLTDDVTVPGGAPFFQRSDKGFDNLVEVSKGNCRRFASCDGYFFVDEQFDRIVCWRRVICPNAAQGSIAIMWRKYVMNRKRSRSIFLLFLFMIPIDCIADAFDGSKPLKGFVGKIIEINQFKISLISPGNLCWLDKKRSRNQN